MILDVYRALSHVAAPVLHAMLARRVARGKEIANRLSEKWGNSSRPRPEGRLIWFHAASVGETQSILPLIEYLHTHMPDAHFLLTTVTVTSAHVAAEKLPARAIHQFLPLDVPAACEAFILHWKPDAAWFTESELWPNLIQAIQRSVPLYGIINGRMSDRSARMWGWAAGSMRSLLSGMQIYAQSARDAEKFSALGATTVHTLGNLKWDAPALSSRDADVASLMNQIGGRPVWLAASIHQGEYAEIAERLQPLMKEAFPDILTIVVPRHPEHAHYFQTTCKGVATRSRGEIIADTTRYYIADTIGELGLFYRVSKVALIGGSLIPHGGQNLIEASRLGCVPVCGPSMFNFAEPLATLKDAGACVQVTHTDGAAEAMVSLLRDPNRYAQMKEAGLTSMQRFSGLTSRTGSHMMDTMRRAWS